MGKRLLTLVLDAEKLRNFQLPSKDRASVDALWMCMHLSEVCVSFMRRTPVGELYISAWASALLVRLNWAMRRPQSVGRVTVRLPRFFVYIN